MRFENNPRLVAKCNKCLQLIFSDVEYIYIMERGKKIYYHYQCQPNYIDPLIIRKQTKLEEAKLNKEVKEELEHETKHEK